MNKQNEIKTLTHEGEIRRQKMLSELKSEMNRSIERRSRRNTLVALGISACLVGAIVWTSTWNAEPENHVVDNELTQPKTSEDFDAVAPQPSEYRQLTFKTMSDEELLDVLAKMGKPSVLGEIGGETTLVLQGNP